MMVQMQRCLSMFRERMFSWGNPTVTAALNITHVLKFPAEKNWNGQSTFHTGILQLAPPAPKKAGAFKAGMTVTKKKMEVETDPVKLVNYLCGGNYKKNSPEIKLGPDFAYPDWLYTLRTDGEPTLEELDPNSIEYWMEVRKLRMISHRRIQKTLRGRLFMFKKDDRYLTALKERRDKLFGKVL